jgi:hypothetical protein
VAVFLVSKICCGLTEIESSGRGNEIDWSDRTCLFCSKRQRGNHNFEGVKELITGTCRSRES